MPLNASRKRELRAAANRLKARIALAGGEPSEDALTNVRRALARTELVKVRVHCEDRQACKSVGDELARRVPCELVSRVGRVLLLYQPAAARRAPDESPQARSRASGDEASASRATPPPLESAT